MRPTVLLLLFLLAGCATRPVFDNAPLDPAPQPYRVADDGKRWLEREVLWGGMILEVRNFERHTEIEVLAFPLEPAQRPVPTAVDQGRFIAILPGFADPATLPEGRFLTLTGRITGDRHDLLHTRPYAWPEVAVERLHLWPTDFREQRVRFSVGIGVGIH